jgi:2-succinyl-6-hydroxy-2,4-cyclohexadiene-1-carboxylate synthase
MYIKNSKSKIFIKKDKSLNKTPILFVHGFTGTSKSWSSVRSKLGRPSLAVDIPGHGKSSFNDISETYFFKDFSNELYISLKELGIKKISLCGYSLGGRLAITFAAKYPDMVNALLVESTSLGIEDRIDREVRYKKDLSISESIKENLHEFARNWSSNKLFENQLLRNEIGFNNQKLIRQSHNKDQLALSLKTFSVGNMPFLRNQFQKFNFPIIIVNGKDDIKYIKEGRTMLKLNKNAKQYIINNASHNVHLENEESYLEVISDIFN